MKSQRGLKLLLEQTRQLGISDWRRAKEFPFLATIPMTMIRPMNDERIVLRNCQAMLPVFARGQPKVAASLPGD